MLNRMATLVIYGRRHRATLHTDRRNRALAITGRSMEEPTMIHALRAKNCRIIWPIIKRAIDRGHFLSASAADESCENADRAVTSCREILVFFGNAPFRLIFPIVIVIRNCK